MIFLNSFLAADELSICLHPTYANNLTSITVKNVLLDTLYATSNPDVEMAKDIPMEWDFDTILYTPYDTTVIASNVDWILKTVTHLVVKRKLETDFNWTTIYVKNINELEDFSISEVDITPTTGRYVYALVPMLNHNEGTYLTTTVDVEVNKLALIDTSGAWATLITDGSCNTTNTTPGSFITTLNSKFPTYVSNTIANYQTITVSGEFYPTDDYCDLDAMFDDVKRNKYIREFVQFLTNRKPKVLKSMDGRIWLVMVDDGVTDNMSDYFKSREISFTCVEIGDINSTEDLYEAGIVDVPYEYW